MRLNLLPLRTAVVGSYPQPESLIERPTLLAAGVPRIPARAIWRPNEDGLEAAQDLATISAISDMESAGLDIVTDGEIRRESYSNRFANALSGLDIDNPAQVPNRTNGTTWVPRIVGPIERHRPIQLRDMQFLRAHTDRIAKITLPGPFTMSMQAHNEFYASPRDAAMAYADAVNSEIHDLFAAGADIVQLDEPWVQARHEQAREFAVEAINKALDGVTGTTTVHVCFGYASAVKDKPSGYSFLPELDAVDADQISIEAAQPGLDMEVLESLPSKAILVGVIGMDNIEAESPKLVAERIRAALRHLPPERMVVAPDCGMKYLTRESALAKLTAMVEGARIVRAELGLE